MRFQPPFKKLRPGAARLAALWALLLGLVIPQMALAQLDTFRLDVTRSPRDQRAVFLKGEANAALPMTPGATAADFLRTYGSVFGIVDVDQQLSQTKEETDEVGFTHTTFEQYYQGLHVFTGQLKVHRNAKGEFVSANGDFYIIPDRVSTAPEISEADAVFFAQGVLAEGSPSLEQSELVIVDPNWYGDPARGARLAYYLVLTDMSVGLRQAFFVDAITGEIMDDWTLLHTAIDREIHEGVGVPGTLARSEGDPAHNNVEVNQAYDFAGDVYGYFDRGHGRDGYDDNGSTMIMTVDSNLYCPNAFWSPDYQMWFYCDGLVTDDVVAHEMTHAITEKTANLVYQNESGQLNESFSDVFGELVDLFNGDAAFPGSPGGIAWPTTPSGTGTDTGNNLRSACSTSPGHADGVRWLVGEDEVPLGGAIRDMWDPTCYGHPDKATSSLQTCAGYDNGGVHTGSGIPNHAFAMLVDGKSFNGYNVTGIGPIKAGAIWYRALVNYLTPGADFLDAYNALTQSANDLIGVHPKDPRTGNNLLVPITVSDAFQVDQALKAVEMDLGGSACPGSCCDREQGTCVDGVFASECTDGFFSPGQSCASLNPPCSQPGPDAHMIVLLDRTGSMMTVRSSTGNTRCYDALEQAKQDVVDFFGNNPNRKAAVWTFAGNTYTQLTAGFVDLLDAQTALFSLDGVICTGATPLADTLCDAVDFFPGGLAIGDKILSINSDGDENWSSGACSGPNSNTYPPPGGNYDTGSWQKKAWNKINGAAVAQIRHWGNFGIPLTEGGLRFDMETGTTIGPVQGDIVFFQDIAGINGGNYVQEHDGPPAPTPGEGCLVLDGIVTWSNGSDWDTTCVSSPGCATTCATCPGGFLSTSCLGVNFFNNTAMDPLLHPLATTPTKPRITPLVGSPALSAHPNAKVVRPDQVDSWFGTACFAGAVDYVANWPAGDWTQGWTWYGETATDQMDRVDLPPSDFAAGDFKTDVVANIVGAEAWTPDRSPYYLQGPIEVEPGATLSIRAGTVVMAAPGACLIVKQGARIFADGTEAEPIIFTVPGWEAGNQQIGSWGGVAINGNAVANCPSATGGACVTTAESGPCFLPKAGQFGGSDDADSSGRLTYVRVEFAGDFDGQSGGTAFQFNGVGSGTELSFLQAHMSSGDLFQWNGGDTRSKNFVASLGLGNGFDWQGGFRGKHQFGVVLHSTRNDSGNGVDGRNSSFNPDCPSRSNGKFSNLTLVGSNVAQSGVVLSDGTCGTVLNSVVTGYNSFGLTVQQPATMKNCAGTSGQALDKFYCEVTAAPEAPVARFGASISPNPTVSTSVFSFNLPTSTSVEVKIFDARGRLIETVVDEPMSAGRHSVSWNPREHAAGVYYYAVTTPIGTAQGKIMVLDR